MAESIDQLQIEITAQAVMANNAIDEFIKRINELSVSIKKIDSSKITKLSTALNALMSPQLSNNAVKITNAFANFNKQAGNINATTNAITNALNSSNRAITNTTKNTFSLSSAIGRFYRSSFYITRAIKGLYSSVKSTADYIEAFNYYTVAFEKIALEWDKNFESYGSENAQKYSNAFVGQMNEELGKLSGLKLNLSADLESGTLAESGMKNLSLNIQEVTQYASQLASITNSVGQNGTVSLTASNVFTKLAGDMSSLFNVDYSAVANNLQSGLIGQSRALYKYGIDITNATLQTYAYEMGLEKAVAEMTQAEKMQLRMVAILDQSKVAWGDLADTINTPANMLRQWTNNCKEASMVLGQLFIPLLEHVLPVMNGVAIATKQFLTNVAGFMGVKIDLSSIGTGTSDALEELEDVSGGYEDTATAAKEYKNQLQGFDKLNLLTTQETGGASGGNSGSGTIDLTDEILDAASEYEKVWDEAYKNMENKAQGFADNFASAFKSIENIIQDFTIGDYFQAGQDVSKLVISINDFFAKAISNVNWQQIGENVGLFFAGINWTEVFSSAGRFIREGITASIELWSGSFDVAPFETAFLTILALPGIVGLGSKIITLITNPFKKIADLLLPVITAISNPISKMFELWATGVYTLGESFVAVFGVGGVITVALTGLAVGLGVVFAKNEEVRQSFDEAVNSIKTGLQPTLEFLTNDLLPDLQNGWNTFLDVLQPFGEFLNNVFVSIWQDMLNPALMYLGETVLPLLASALETTWNDVFVPLGNFLADVFTPIVEGITWVLDLLWKNVIVPLAQALGNVLGKAFEGIVEIWNKRVVPAINAIIVILQFLWDNILSPFIDYLKNEWGPVFEGVFDSIKDVINGLSLALGGVIDFITGVFTGDWEKAWNIISEWFNTNVVTPISDSFLELWGNVSEYFSNLWEDISAVWKTVSTWFSQKVIEPIVRFFKGFFMRIQQIFEGLWIIVQAVWIVASDWFNENIITPVIGFFRGLWERVAGFFTQLWSDIKGIWNIVSEWFNINVVTPISTLFSDVSLRIKEYFTIAKNAVLDVWNAVSNWFNTNIAIPVTNVFQTACNKIGEFFSGLWSGIKSGVVSAMNAVIGGIESAINFIVNGINKIINGFNKIVSWAAKVAEVDWGGVDTIPKVSLSRVSCYATGGFPEDGWFRASHGEIMGRFDNGQSVVANNMQITEGIAQGVRNANAEQNALLREQNALLRQILAKDSGISTRDIFEAVRTENRDYINRNGQSAFIY